MNQGTIYHSGNMTSFFLLSYVRKAPGEHVHILHTDSSFLTELYEHTHPAPTSTTPQIKSPIAACLSKMTKIICVRWGFICGEYSLNTLSLYVCYRMWMDVFLFSWSQCMVALESIVWVLLRICIVTFTYLPCTMYIRFMGHIRGGIHGLMMEEKWWKWCVWYSSLCRGGIYGYMCFENTYRQRIKRTFNFIFLCFVWHFVYAFCVWKVVLK